jgi:PKD repeat protein
LFMPQKPLQLIMKSLYRYTLIVAVALSCSCSEQETAQGLEGGPCHEDGTCNTGLKCSAGVCVLEDRADGSVTAPDGTAGDGPVTAPDGTAADGFRPPVADFVGSPRSGESPLEVQFTSLSTGTPPLTYKWDMDEVSDLPDLRLPNPRWRFWLEDGDETRTITLTVTNAYGSDTVRKVDYITLGVQPVAPEASFTATPTTGAFPLVVRFTDTSTGSPTSWAWAFGDSGTSTEQNPSHTYTAAGTYTVSLTATNAVGSDTKTVTDMVAATPPGAPVASFTASPTSGTIPFSVQFTDTSTGAPTSWAWSFGDGGTSASQSPSHSYTVAGSYTVTLVAANAYGSNTMTKTSYITAGASGGTTYGVTLTAGTSYYPVGGGAEYTGVVTPTDSRICQTVSSLSALRAALSSCPPGKIVFVPGGASIDLTGASEVTIPAGVTLASDRGYGGSLGAYFHRDSASDAWTYGTLVASGDSVRITGIRLKGMHHDWQASGNVYAAIGEANKTGLEVDNCELWDWSYAGVCLENTSDGGYTAHIHHNKIHDMVGGEGGYGYGVMQAFGNTIIEANQFNRMRHSVIWEGCAGETSTFRHNYVGSEGTDSQLDCHKNCGGWTAGGVSGDRFDVHHNTFIYDGSVAWNLYGTPASGAYIEWNDWATKVQALNGWTRIYMTNNKLGGVIYASGQ